MAGGARVVIDPSARISRTAVWDDVTIGRDAELIECIVGDGARIPDGARYTRCAIVPAGGRTARADERIERRVVDQADRVEQAVSKTDGGVRP